MKRLLPLLLALVPLASCSWWAQLDRADHRQEYVQRHSLLDSGGWRLDVATLALEWKATDQRVLIFPTGPFSFHVDSGFLGEAEVLMWEDQQRHAVFDAAVSSEEAIAMVWKDSLVSVAETSTTFSQQSESKSGWKLPWWVWALGVSVLFMSAFILMKKWRIV